MRVNVIGAGVSGLSCAIRLCEAGHAVRVLARARGEAIVSQVAAAIWHPYNIQPVDRAAAWAAASYAELLRLSRDRPEAGIRLRQGIELLREAPPTPLWWTDAVPGLRPARADELPAGYAAGYVFQSPIAEMPRYLAWLEARLAALGGVIEPVDVDTIGGAFRAADVVVNCSGLGARELAGDDRLQPIRGQVLWLRQVGLERFWLDHQGPEGMTYIIPRGHDIVLGGTHQPGQHDLRPDPETADAILDRCLRLEPALAGAEVLAHRVGLRPGRPEVRLEAEDTPAGLLLHDYGHAGAGVTLSWGCADAVLALLHDRLG